MDGRKETAIDDRLKHELGNALMIVLSYAQIIDRRIPDDPVVHDAIGQIKAAVVRSRTAVDDASRQLSEVAQRLSSSRPA